MTFCERLEGRRLLSAAAVAGGHNPQAAPNDAFTADFGFVNGRNRSAFASAPDGTHFDFSLSGNGTGHAVADGVGFALTLTGTDARSALNVFTDNFGLITSLTTDGSLRSIDARECTIGGDVAVAGTLGAASLFGLSSEIGNTIHLDIAGAGVPTDLGIALVSDVTLTTASPIRSLRVERWADLNPEPDVITAPSIGSIKTFGARNVTGSFEADLNLTAEGGQSLRQMNVLGGLNGSTIRAAGSVGNITVGAMHDSALLAGVSPSVAGLPTSASDFVSSQSIASVTVRNRTGAAFSDSVIAAASIGRIRMGKVGTNATAPTTFGVAAVNVKDYRRLTNTKPVVRKNVTTPEIFDSEGSYAAEVVA